MTDNESRDDGRVKLVLRAVDDMRSIAGAAPNPRVLQSTANLLHAARARVEKAQWRSDLIAVNAIRTAAAWLGEESPA